MKQIISIMMFAVMLLSSCTGDKKAQTLDADGQRTVNALVEAINGATKQAMEATSPVDPTEVLPPALVPVLGDVKKYGQYELTDKDRKMMKDAVDGFFTTITAQYDTIPGSETIVPVINEMKSYITSSVDKAQKLGDMISNEMPNN